MPVPQTFATGAAGLATKWSARFMHVLRLPWPAPSPRTAEFSMYAFWLMSSLVFFTKAAVLQPRRAARTTAAARMSETAYRTSG